MDNQPIQPGSTGPFSSMPTGGGLGTPPGGGGGRSPLLIVFIVLLGLGTIAFGTLTVVFANKSATATKVLNARVQEAAKKAAEIQKKNDEDAYTKASESPFRSYAAPLEYGSFVIAFPKNWSSYVDEESSGKQVQMILNPDFIRKTKGNDGLMAARITFEERTKATVLAQYTSQVKSGKLKQTDTKVSEQDAFEFEGTFTDKKTVRLVVVPIRDKVLIFSTEDAKYAEEFDQILAQAKIIP